MHGAGWLGGIGFTMALFTAAFPDPAMLDVAKLAILSASALAGLVGAILLRRAKAQ